MISVADALQSVLNVCQRLPPVTVSLHSALGKVLAQDIRAPDPLPPYPASVKVTYPISHSFPFPFHFPYFSFLLFFMYVSVNFDE